MNHTPGPWATHKTEGNGGNIPDRLEIVGPEEGRRRSLIASIYGFKLPEGQANAQLIAAAPELLECLQHIQGIVSESQGVAGWHQNGQIASWDELGLREEIDGVLAKARGEEGEEDA